MHVTRTSGLSLAAGLLQERGALPAYAQLQAEHLIGAELAGRPQHGLGQLPAILGAIERGLVDPRTDGDCYWRGHGLLDVEGRRGLGPAVAMAAVARLADRLPRTGIALAAIRGCGPLGLASRYAEALAAGGSIGLILAPPDDTAEDGAAGSVTIAVPAADGPVVVDIPAAGQARHHDGRSPAAPGLGLAIDLVVAALTGEARALAAQPGRGAVLIAVEPASSPGLADYLSACVDDHQTAPPSVTRLGDRRLRRTSRQPAGGFDIEPALWQRLNALELARPAVAGRFRS